MVASCCCENKFKCEMVSAGKYKFGEMQKKHLVRILRTNIVVRVGGGWETMESFLNQHDPCRVTGKGNIESILANLPKPGEALGRNLHLFLYFFCLTSHFVSSKAELHPNLEHSDPKISTIWTMFDIKLQSFTSLKNQTNCRSDEC